MLEDSKEGGGSHIPCLDEEGVGGTTRGCSVRSIGMLLCVLPGKQTDTAKKLHNGSVSVVYFGSFSLNKLKIYMDFQVLDLWYQSLPRDYFVKDLVVELNQWHREGYVDRDIWNHLQKYLKSDVLSDSFSHLTVSSGNTVVTGTSFRLSEEGRA